MIENQDIAVQRNFESIRKFYDDILLPGVFAITGEYNMEHFSNALSFSRALMAAFKNNYSIKNIQLLRASVETINALLPALQYAGTNIKLIFVGDLSEESLNSLCLSFYNNPNKPEIRLISPTNISSLCKKMVDHFNKKDGGDIEFEDINELQNSDIQTSLKRPFEPTLQAQQADDSMNKKIRLDHNNNKGNGMDVESTQWGHANQLMTNNINDSDQHNPQYPPNSNINNFQNMLNSGNVAQAMHMQSQ